MKTVLTACALLSCGTLLCAQPAPSAATKPGKQKAIPVMSPAAISNMLARTGGLLPTPAEGPAILFLNTQTRVAAGSIDATAKQIEKILRLPVTAKIQSSAEPVKEALVALSEKGTAAVIVIGDSAGYPSLLVAPENRWAMVNVAALAGDGASSEALVDRTQKEIWRAFGLLLGAAHSNYEQCLLKPVSRPSDLDTFKPKTLCPEPFGKIMTQAQAWGMKPLRMTTYRKAVEEGWAPAPTNDIQRTIWKELKK